MLTIFPFVVKVLSWEQYYYDTEKTFAESLERRLQMIPIVMLCLCVSKHSSAVWVGDLPRISTWSSLPSIKRAITMAPD